jgi:hypothetical protein
MKSGTPRHPEMALVIGPRYGNVRLSIWKWSGKRNQPLPHELTETLKRDAEKRQRITEEEPSLTGPPCRIPAEPALDAAKPRRIRVPLHGS